MIPVSAFILLVGSLVVQVISLLDPQSRAGRLAPWLNLGASVLLFAFFIMRSIAIRFPALTNMYESLVFFTACITLVLFFFHIRRGISLSPFILFGGTVLAFGLLALSSSPLMAKEAAPPIPALRSHWLVLHVALSFIGEAFFAVAFAASVYYLFLKETSARRERVDRFIYTSIGIGYPIFTFGALIFGAVWAQFAWGRYWSWDPKETWALVTWVLYTGYLHVRLVSRKKGKLPAVLSVTAFAAAMFTFFGVNYLMSGLHSY
jgi:ABC-type transport system involved in cytochrome c biogenesis permease subunit